LLDCRFDVLDALEAQGSSNGAPKTLLTIEDCGELD